ncbi:MAG: DUF4363 family protein [Clostridia bacterium]|nr:DUF4363 family protein [Clostridia bacterium]
MTVAFLILVLIIAGWQIENGILKQMSSDMTDKLDLVMIALQEGNFDEAADLADEFIDAWSDCEKWVATLTPHTEVDEISRNAAKLKVFSAGDGKDDALSTVMETKEIFDEITRKTKVNLMNVF